MQKKSHDKDNGHDHLDKDPTLFWFLLSKQSNPSTTYLLPNWAKNTKYNFPDFFPRIFMIRWQMTNPGIFHTDWKGSAWIKMNKIFLCNNFSKYFCALHIVLDKDVLLLYVIFHYYIFSRGLFPNKLVALDFVFHDGVGGQVFDSLKVLGRKYGNLITVITKLILYNHWRFSQYSNFKQFFSE